MEVCTRVSLIWTIALCFALISLKSPAWSQTGSELTPKPATAATRAYLDRVAASLPFADREDFDLVNRGFIAGVPGNRIVDANGQVLQGLDVGAFFSQATPSTVNASLWRNAGLVAQSGLFKLSDRIYQIRGLDYAKMTVVLGNTGFIVVDRLMITEAAQAGLDLLRQHVGDRPVDASRARTLRVDRASFIAAVPNRSTSTTLSSDDATLLNRFSRLFEAPRTGFGLATPRPRG
jgi:alkyl sulfatase BDS1-like metallo-beta-lactamase superfamily hydrolase